MEEEKTPTLISSALKWGIISGAVGIAIVIVFYVIDYSWLADWKLLVIGLAIGITIIIYGGIEYRNQVGGFLSYGKAWQHGFIMLAISGILGVIFNLILYTVIDPELPKKVTEVAMENTQAMMEKFGVQPGPEMDKAMAKAEADSLERMTPIGMAKTYVFQLIFAAIFALITAIFVKKNPPVDQM